MTAMPVLETTRLLIRPFSMDDLPRIHQILDIDLEAGETGTSGAQTLAMREHWLQWTILGYEQYAQLYQPPYGERAVVCKEQGVLIGTIGFVPCLDAFEQLPNFSTAPQPNRFASAEFGLYYAIAPSFQRRGYATEAATAMIEYAFRHLRVKRIIATTATTNQASVEVMRKLGMRIERNPFPDPPWLQVVGTLENNM